MSDQHEPQPADHLAHVRAKAARVAALKKAYDEAETELRKAAVSARRAGELVGDIQEATGWSHKKLNEVLRAGGIPGDRSAPRKRKTTP